MELEGRLDFSEQTKKVTEKELVVAKAELLSMKADFKEKLKKTDNTDLKMLNQKLKDQLAIQLAAGEL